MERPAEYASVVYGPTVSRAWEQYREPSGANEIQVEIRNDDVNVRSWIYVESCDPTAAIVLTHDGLVMGESMGLSGMCSTDVEAMMRVLDGGSD